MGVWAYVLANSAAEIEARFPELAVAEEPPSWMSDDYRGRLRARTIDLDSPSGLLRNILEERTKGA